MTDVLSGQRRLVGDAGVSALCARISSRVRAQPPEPLAGQPARPLLLRALPGGREACRHPRRSAARQVADDIEAYLSSDVDFPADMAEAFWLADTRTDGALKAFLDWRCTVVTSLVQRFAQAVRKDATVAVIPSVARPTAGAWYEGSDLAALAEAAGIIEACFYEPGAAQIKADLFDVKRRLRGKGRLRGIVRPLSRPRYANRISRRDARARRRRGFARSRSTIGATSGTRI